MTLEYMKLQYTLPNGKLVEVTWSRETAQFGPTIEGVLQMMTETEKAQFAALSDAARRALEALT